MGTKQMRAEDIQRDMLVVFEGQYGTRFEFVERIDGPNAHGHYYIRFTSGAVSFYPAPHKFTVVTCDFCATPNMALRAGHNHFGRQYTLTVEQRTEAVTLKELAAELGTSVGLLIAFSADDSVLEYALDETLPESLAKHLREAYQRAE